MFGPKLEARSYTTLLLVIIASLLTFSLTAQYEMQDRGEAEYSDVAASRDVAAALQILRLVTRVASRRPPNRGGRAIAPEIICPATLR